MQDDYNDNEKKSNQEDLEDGKSPQEWQAHWVSELDAAKKFMQPFYHDADRAVDYSLGNPPSHGHDDRANGVKRFNIFASNIETILAQTYSRVPSPSVSRRFTVADDDVARVASIIIQRALSYDLEEEDQFDDIAKALIKDRVVSSMAQVWVRFEGDINPAKEQGIENQFGSEESNDPERADYIDPVDGDQWIDPGTIQPTSQLEGSEPAITNERVITEYVHYKDFLYSPCRVWKEARWVARRLYMNREQMEKRFGEEIAEQVGYDIDPSDIDGKYQQSQKNNQENESSGTCHQAEVFEIWDKETRTVFWVNTGIERLLDHHEDLFGLKSFFPCPKPLFGPMSTKRLRPVTTFSLIRSQLEELNLVNTRISMITDAIKAVGIYDGSNAKDLARLFDATDNQMIPVQNWSTFSEKEGLRGVVDWFPLGQFIQALQQLISARESIKQQIYEVTGMSDIMRGATKASESAAAQNIKAQFASIRMGALQQEVAQFFSEIVKIRAHLMGKFYSPKRVMTMVGIVDQADLPYVQSALALWADEGISSFRIVITADSLAMPNLEAEKQNRTQFVTAAGGYIKTIAEVAKGSPESLPAALTLLKFGIAGFKGADSIEGALDQAIASAQASISQPRQPSPAEQLEAQRAQVELAAGQLELKKIELEIARVQQQAQLDQQRYQLELAQIQANNQVKNTRLGIENKKTEIKHSIDQQRVDNERVTNLIKDRKISLEHQPDMTVVLADPAQG